MNTSRLAGSGILGLSLLLSACSLAPGMPSPVPATSGAPTSVARPSATPVPTMAPADIAGAMILDGQVILVGKQEGAYQVLTGGSAKVGSAEIDSKGTVRGADGSTKPLETGMLLDTQGSIKAAETGKVIQAKRKLMIPLTDGGSAKNGMYADYAPARVSEAGSAATVLFFKASWCPTCRAVDADISSNLDKIPSNVQILKVDYDSSPELKTKYGVTTQHTFVLVDAQGTKLRSWIGSPTLQDVVDNALAG